MNFSTRILTHLKIDLKIPDNVDFYYDSADKYTYDKKSNITEVKPSERTFINTVMKFVKKIFLFV